MQKRIGPPQADWLGISSSVMCLVHCMALPTIIGFSATLVDDGGPWVHALFLAFALLAVVNTRLRQAPLKLLLYAGCLLLAAALCLLPHTTIGAVVQGAGSLLLVTGHGINLAKVHSCTGKVPAASACSCK